MNDQETRTKNSSKNLKVGISIVAAVVIVAITVGSIVLINSFKSGSLVAQIPTSSNDGNNTNFAKNGDSIESVANKLSPSVVSVLTKTRSSSRYYNSQEQEGAGTGIIVSKNGYILTNKHVINGASSVSVVLSDGSTYDSIKVVATDPLNDIAFLKISNVENLTAAELGDSKTLGIGQEVVAIGNALGQYQNTVTSGIISGTNRSIQAATSSGKTETLTDMIQTDASINSGNSGGPLVNAKGQVVGINTAVASSAQGIGFAIPIGAAKGMLSQILETGNAERAYVGVNYVQITPDVAKDFDLPVKAGAYVYAENGNSVATDGPADEAGIKNKDIITKVNGVEVGEKGSVATLTAEYRSGDTIEITIIREGKEKVVKVTLAAYSE